MNAFKSIFLIGIIVLFPYFGNSQNQWITDNEMQFKIQLPQNYNQNQMYDGTDKVLTLLSPDENVMVRVRAIKATSQLTADLLQQVFEQNIISGAQRIMNKDGDLHGIPARASAYTWSVDGSDAVLGVYYIIQNNFAYVVWTAVPQNLLQQRSSEADRIIDSFTLLHSFATSAIAGTLNTNSNNRVVLLNANLGSQVDDRLKILNPSSGFHSNTTKINLSFSYSGNTYATPVILKWFSRTHNRKVEEYALNTPNENNGHGFGFISNSGNNWPLGNYYVEIWHDGKNLGTRDFQIQ